ncbi:FepA family TonB-dependent siderophore receptor [Luteimonas sp. BDR2-5]|uniref:FepA family TonB-dependent siderophore receptor n=1 Tax=Proluteimonas luteida TaxID=2878685 RepID=UPI001E3D62CE|nr:FepA family TonB-dependent siderophore receptor [Luteimonas sp. BDR2-5]MCD9028296.1 FepA family TonB-dependent siderophore receptor [Luteimonas sp. BDR2-5]
MSRPRPPAIRLPGALATAIALSLSSTALAQDDVDDARTLDTVRVTAEQIAREALGASTVLSDDIQRQPSRNDIAELLRTLPGVNLTGNSTSGQRGNNRQIDIRGMGPENTLILVDGKPVSSRNSVRYGWRGERDSRGDTSWVPPEQIERIEVLRGPAAARYGNGAAGGVVNIVTRPPSDVFGGSLNLYGQVPQHGVDGGSQRAGVQMSGPLGERLSFRLSGNVSKADADDYDINRDHASARTGANAGSFPAGREGVRGRTVNGQLLWDVAPGHRIDVGAGFSRQGNIYAGDTQNTNRNPEVLDRIGAETNRMYRQTWDVTHRGTYGDDTTSLSYVTLEQTRNKRLLEGLAGGTEGIFIVGGGFGSIDLRNLTAHGEFSRTLSGDGVDHVLTVGIEGVDSRLEDDASALKDRNPQPNVPTPPFAWEGRADARVLSAFVEDNIYLGERWILTPGLRFDHHDRYGGNWSPALNASFRFAPEWELKAGIARAYKAPNLYQGNEGYALYSAGIGCWGGGGPCFLVGNPDLEAETSINKELGVQFSGERLQAGLTYFHNDYRDKVDAGHTVVATHDGYDVFRWDNVPKAVVAGLEGNLNLRFSPALAWNTNVTRMLESENKSTGEYLSTIPEYTVNTSLDWQAGDRFSLLAKATFYGEQKPQKFDYHGDPVSGSAADRMPGYALVGLSGRYRITDTVNLVLGVDNLLDKRIFRRGNASGVNLGTPNEIEGAGAYTYNEPGRAYFVAVNIGF